MEEVRDLINIIINSPLEIVIISYPNIFYFNNF